MNTYIIECNIPRVISVEADNEADARSKAPQALSQDLADINAPSLLADSAKYIVIGRE